MTPALERAAYFVNWAYGNAPCPADGVRKKIGAQIRAWSEAGIRTKLFVAARVDCRSVWSTEIPDEDLRIELAPDRLGRLTALRRLRTAIDEWAPRFLYLRQEDWLPPLERLVRAVPSFMEINGDDLAEARSGPIHYRVYRRLTRSRLQRAATGFVSVSDEFARSRSLVPAGKPFTVIANGIDLDAFSVLPPNPDATVRIGFLGAELGARWHGVPKLLELARRRPTWEFELIGPTRGALGDVPSNVHAHGVLTRSAYEPILSRCDVGVGTLAAHAKGLYEASPLKVREYLAYGLPVITGVRDTDFPRAVPFLLELPNEERNVSRNIDRIEAFIGAWKGRRVPRDDVQHIDARAKNARRLAFIAGTLGAESSRPAPPGA